jgi:hypothetical protein
MAGEARPLVSVVIPAFNAAATIAESLRSALAQTWRELELIVVDDGSSDGTAAVAEAAAAADPRVVILRRPRSGGPSAARNAGIARASGSFVAPLDADDLWHPEKIERQMAAALGPARPALVYTFCRRIDGGGRITGHLDAVAVDGPAFARHLYLNFVGASAALFRRDILLAAGGYEERVARSEDFVTQARVAALGAVAAIPLFLVGYRSTPGSQSSDREAMYAAWLDVRAILEAEYPDLPALPLRWTDGRRALALAEGRAYRRRFAAAVPPLLTALRHDPVRGLLHIAGLAARRRPPPPPEAGRHFLEADPEAGVEPMAIEGTRAGSLLRRLEARRFERLRRLDLSRACAPERSPRRE